MKIQQETNSVTKRIISIIKSEYSNEWNNLFAKWHRQFCKPLENEQFSVHLDVGKGANKTVFETAAIVCAK